MENLVPQTIQFPDFKIRRRLPNCKRGPMKPCIGFFKSMRDFFLVFDNVLVPLIPRNHRLAIFLPNIISHQIHTSVNKFDGMKCTFTHSYGTTALVWTIIQLVIWSSLIKRNSASFKYVFRSKFSCDISVWSILVSLRPNNG